MDLRLTDDQELLRRSIREFAESEIRPHVREWDDAQHFPAELLPRLAALGLMGIQFPEAYGGAAMSSVDYCISIEELARVDPSVCLSVAAHNGLGAAHIAAFGTEEQKQKYLVPLAKGEQLSAWGLTEASAGSDAAAMRTTARRDGDTWVINGTKQFISHADHADFILLVAVTGENETPKGPRPRFTTFLVDKDLPGVEVRPIGCVSARGYNPHLIGLTDVRVPGGSILGEEGHGFDFAVEWLYSSRVMMAAHCVGRARGRRRRADPWRVRLHQGLSC